MFENVVSVDSQSTLKSVVSSPRKRWPWLLGAIVVIGGAVGAILATRAGDDDAIETVAAFEAAIERDDLDAAHSLVDYRFRLDEVLQNFWMAGTEEDRVELVRLTQGMLADTTKNQWPDCCRGRSMARHVQSDDGAVVWVETRPSGDGAPDFVWRYRLHRRDGAWRITQREYIRDRVPTDSTRFWPMARKAVALRLGRPPTLTEFRANLLSVMPELRVRTYRVPSREELRKLQQEQKDLQDGSNDP